MSTGPTDVNEIRRQMAQIRRELHEDVRDVVATAEAATDWRRYLAAYPWVALGAAFSIGYLIVPARKAKALSIYEPARTFREVDEPARSRVVETRRVETPAEEKKRKRGIVGAVLGMVTPILIKSAKGYALTFLEGWMQQQLLKQFQAGPPPPPGEVGPAPGPRTAPRPPGGPGFGTGPFPGSGPGYGPFSPGH